MNKSIFYILITLVSVSACKNISEEKCAPVPDTKGSVVTLKFESLGDSLPAITTKTELVDFLTRHPALRDGYFSRKSYPDDSVFINTLFRKFTHPAIDTLVMEKRRVFGDESSLKAEFTKAFSNIHYYFPSYRFPKIVTMVSGFQSGADMMVSDSLIVIGLDYFLGKGAKYRPNDMYEYMLRRYEPGFVVPSVLLIMGIDPSINRSNATDKTVLADMMSYGKAYFFAKHMIPCAPDSVLIGFTAKEMAGSREYESYIYKHLIEKEVLYSTSMQVKQHYLGERPNTNEIGKECPGRIAQWTGWQIVKQYAETHPELTLPELMKISSAEKIFHDAKYKP